MVATVNMIGQKQSQQQKSTGLASGGLCWDQSYPSKLESGPGLCQVRGYMVLPVSLGLPASSSLLVLGACSLRVLPWVLVQKPWRSFSLTSSEASPQGLLPT